MLRQEAAHVVRLRLVRIMGCVAVQAICRAECCVGHELRREVDPETVVAAHLQNFHQECHFEDLCPCASVACDTGP